MKKQKKFFVVICILIFFAFIFIFKFYENENKTVMKPITTDEMNFIYDSNPYTDEIRFSSAKVENINEDDQDFYCPTPDQTGINDCLMNIYLKEYGSNNYTGKYLSKFNELLISYGTGSLTIEEIISEVEMLDYWSEKRTDLAKDVTDYQVSITDIFVDSFETDSKLMNEIIGELSRKDMLKMSDYFQVLIYFDHEKQKNIVLAVDLIYMEESW